MALTQRYLEIILFKAYANLRSEAARTYLSFMWWVIDPILSMAVYYVVFALLLQRETQDYVPFLIIGLITWQWFTNTINHGMTTIHGNIQLMNQVHLPKVVFPSIEILMDTFKFSIVFILVLLFLWIYGFGVGAAYLSLPLILGVQLLFTVALTYLLAAIIPFLPDLKYLVQTILRLVFFLTGIFFDGSKIPEHYQPYFYANPMATLIEDYRNVLMHNIWPDMNALAVICLFSAFGVYAAYRLIGHFDHVYPRVTMQ
ncbi:MAG: ABC transporter permease [Desulfobacterales bacterium]